MEIFLIGIASLMLIFQFFLDSFSWSKRKKKYFGLSILMCGLFTLLISYVVQKNDKLRNESEKRLTEERHNREIDDQQKRFNKSDSINMDLRSELILIRRQNDSLKMQQEKNLAITQFSAQQVSQSVQEVRQKQSCA